jgi:hypothetical protein
MKKKLSFFLIMTALFASMYLRAQDISSGLKIHYTFDNDAGTTVPDVTGNGLDATMEGAAADTIGLPDGNGVTMKNVANYLLLPTGITDGVSDFTIASWVNVENLTTWGRIFDFGTGTSSYMFLAPSNGSVPRFAFKNNGGSEQAVNGPTAFPIGVWTHVAVTGAYNATKGIGDVKMYINGILQGENAAVTITPDSFATTLNYIGKSQWSDPTLNGVVDDFRFYTRALSNDDILSLIGRSADLITQYHALAIGYVEGDSATSVTENLTLPTTMGSNGVTVSWSSSSPDVVSETGVVNRPDRYNSTVILTAILRANATDTLVTSFSVVVQALNPATDALAEWNFVTDSVHINDGVITVGDASGNGYIATCYRSAKIKTIGTTTQYNVLDVGSNNGYLDLGSQDTFGKLIYGLSGDYSIGLYYRTSKAYNFADYGNSFWMFSNSDTTTQTGMMYYEPRRSYAAITASNYNAEQGPMMNAQSPIGSWHHILYSQTGTNGTLYLDGVPVDTAVVTKEPATTLFTTGRTGTICNWIGHPGYTGNSYLKYTMIYDFKIYGYGLSGDDLQSVDGENVPGMISNLNTALAQDSDYQLPDLKAAYDALSLGDLTGVTSNIALPSKSPSYPSVAITWTTSDASVVTKDGVITRPNVYDVNATLTATLSLSSQTLSKSFPITVLANEGTAYTSNLLVKYDFANATTSDTIVTDAAQQHYTGALKGGASIHTIGTSTKYNVLALGSNNGYLDMSKAVGRVIYHLDTAYTISTYYRVDTGYTNIGGNGNFIWTFANRDTLGTTQNGGMYCVLNDREFQITKTYYSTHQGISYGSATPKGAWHNITYTQFGDSGAIYYDGSLIKTDTVMWTPLNSIPKSGYTGTLCNWIGRSPYPSDSYLKKTAIYDFRIYNKSMDSTGIENELNVLTKLPLLDAAYAEYQDIDIATGIQSVNGEKINVYTNANGIKVEGLTGKEKVSVFDIFGRSVRVTNPSEIKVKAGIYILKVDNNAAKVLVR